MIKNKLLQILILDILVSVFGILSVLLITRPGNFQENLITTIIGSGMIGAIIAGSFYYLQETSEAEASKKKAQSFYQTKLIADIADVKQAGPTLWNLSGAETFYFDQTLINALFDVYRSNFDRANEYLAYFPDDALVGNLKALYVEARKSYIKGKKLDNIINQTVRQHHHSKGLIGANDISTRSYIKAKLFADLTDDSVCKHLEWNAVPERASEALELVRVIEEANKLIKQLQKDRKQIAKIADNIVQII